MIIVIALEELDKRVGKTLAEYTATRQPTVVSESLQVADK